jgi:hypothetical protein
MQKKRNEQMSVPQRNAGREAFRPGSVIVPGVVRPRSGTAEFVPSDGGQLYPDTGGDERYFSIRISESFTKDGRALFVKIHKGFVISVVGSAVLWAGIIATIKAL